MSAGPFQALAAATTAAFGSAATYLPADGGSQSVTWVFFERVPGSRLNDLKTPHEGPAADVSQAQIPLAPAADDQFVMGARRFSVKKAERDTAGLFWIMELVEAVS